MKYSNYFLIPCLFVVSTNVTLMSTLAEIYYAPHIIALLFLLLSYVHGEIKRKRSLFRPQTSGNRQEQTEAFDGKF